LHTFNKVLAVKRVHWLRGRAIYQRWKEEELLVNNEMQWTVKYFIYKSDTWRNVPRHNLLPSGPIAYAARQAAQWRDLATRAQRLFIEHNSDYLRLPNL